MRIISTLVVIMLIDSNSGGLLGVDVRNKTGNV